MSRRTLLTSEQRIRLFGIPADSAEMAKHYVLSTEDLAFIRTKRRSGNRLGFAVQLCLLRHPGQGLGIGEHPPEEMIAFIAHQLGGLRRVRPAGPDATRACRRTAEAAVPAQLPAG